MDFTLILFFLFSFVLVTSALAVISTRNMIHSVLFLILAFLNAAFLFILINAEFLAMLLVIVYVGAIAVLFLFVVMMLNVDNLQVKKSINKSLPILLFMAIILFLEIYFITKISAIPDFKTTSLFPLNGEITNAKQIGMVLYTDFFLAFQISGAILFVAMIGAIVLTLSDGRKQVYLRKQKIADQVFRNKENSLEIKKVEFSKGIDI